MSDLDEVKTRMKRQLPEGPEDSKNEKLVQVIITWVVCGVGVGVYKNTCSLVLCSDFFFKIFLHSYNSQIRWDLLCWSLPDACTVSYHLPTSNLTEKADKNTVVLFEQILYKSTCTKLPERLQVFTFKIMLVAKRVEATIEGTKLTFHCIYSRNFGLLATHPTAKKYFIS